MRCCHSSFYSCKHRKSLARKRQRNLKKSIKKLKSSIKIKISRNSGEKRKIVIKKNKIRKSKKRKIISEDFNIRKSHDRSQQTELPALPRNSEAIVIDSSKNTFLDSIKESIQSSIKNSKGGESRTLKKSSIESRMKHDSSKKKIHEAIESVANNKSFINLSILQKAKRNQEQNSQSQNDIHSSLEKSKPDIFNYKNITGASQDTPQNVNSWEITKLNIEKKPRNRKHLSKNKSFANNSRSKLQLNPNNLVDVDYTYKMLKEIENLKLQKNAEMRDRIFGTRISTDNSKITYQNKITYKIYNHRGSSPDGKINQKSAANISYQSPLGKDKKKWSKILSFFKQNINVLVNLLPDQDPNPTPGMFELSRQILTRPKSHSKYRPYSVSSDVNSPLASSQWISNDKVRPFTENNKFRAMRNSRQTHCKSKPILRKMKKINSDANFKYNKVRKKKESVIELNTFTINSSKDESI